MLKNKKMKAIGLLSIALGLGLNMQYAWNDYSFKESPLLVRVVMAQSSSGLCTARGGKEAPDMILRKERCVLEASGGADISISQSGGGGGASGNVKFGDQCICKKVESGYQGELGCNYTWETACKQY